MPDSAYSTPLLQCPADTHQECQDTARLVATGTHTPMDKDPHTPTGLFNHTHMHLNTHGTATNPPRGDEWRLRCLCVWLVCVCLSTTQVKRWVVNKELVHCVSVCVWRRERERGKGKKRKITQFPKYWIPVWWDKSGYNSLFGLLVVHGILAQWPRFEASYSKCVCVCPRALFPKDLANGTVPRSALVLDAGSAALLRIFLHGISPDVLTIKGQQNADCKEKAMSRRKGYWYFRSSWLREWEWEGGRDGERRRGREETKERERRNRTRELFLSHKPLFCEYMWVVCVCDWASSWPAVSLNCLHPLPPCPILTPPPQTASLPPSLPLHLSMSL